MKHILAALAFLPLPQDAGPRFASPPEVRPTDRGVEITFAANAATDCAVSILDARGNVVRHLAAGVLGPKAPAPLQKGSLRQTLVWNRKDDRGKPAEGGPFRVKVALGLRPAFDRTIGHNPLSFGAIRALAAGPGGELYVFHAYGALHPDDDTTACAVLSRDGKYLRTILPYPAGLPEEKLRGFKRLDVGGTRVPFVYQGETRSLVPGVGSLPRQHPAVTRDGRMALVGLQELGRYNQQGVNQVLFLSTDGSPAPGGLLGPVLASKSQTAANLALSPDEKTIYASGSGAVSAFGWGEAEPRPVVRDGLKDPAGIAVDKEGRIYVADRGAHRVAVFRRDGSPEGSLAAESPEWVEVGPDGAVYVLHGPRADVLAKFASWKSDKPVATLAIKASKFEYVRQRPLLALDASAKPPVLWLGSPTAYDGFTLLRIEDQGASFGPPAEKADSGPGGASVMALALDRKGGKLLVNGRSYDLAKQEWGAAATTMDGSKRGMGSFGLDGNLYLLNYPKTLRRYDADLKPLPFPGAPKGNLEGPFTGSMRLRERGITADAAGNIYVLWEKREGGGTFDELYVHGPDGEIKKRLVESEIRMLNSVRLDYEGNVYLALGVRPGKELLPPWFKGQLPDDPKDPDAVRGHNYYPMMYGSIVKFSPNGGAVKSGAGGTACGYGFDNTVDVSGAEWIFFGASNVPSWRTKGTPDICLCESPRFDVDGFGRSFFPDCLGFRVGMLDTAGNLIGWFGKYGNPDGEGLSFQWPHLVCVSDDAAYVGDRLNRRVVAAKLAYAAEEVRGIP
jgi:hypothetical protein